MTNDRQKSGFHDVVTYRRLAQLVAENTRKGSLLLVQGGACTPIAGRLQTAVTGSG